jgi:hypothetical protein
MSKAVKINVKPVVVYGSETWPVTDMDMKRLNMWERKTIKRIYGIYIYGPVVEQGIYGVIEKDGRDLKPL